jgi:hypothetical protein
VMRCPRLKLGLRERRGQAHTMQGQGPVPFAGAMDHSQSAQQAVADRFSTELVNRTLHPSKPWAPLF